MSYCRFAWDGSDVYVYPSAHGIVCSGCRFEKNFAGDFTAGTPEEMIAHLALHRRAGHYVPPYAVEALWLDIPGAGDPVNPEPEELARVKKMIEERKAHEHPQ